VRLAPAADKIALSEGIETALSVQQASGIPCWAHLGTGNRPALPDLCTEVILCADADRAGAECARWFAQAYESEGKFVRIARPSRYRADFNDELRGA
jgi:hypothetical protein